MQPGGDRMKDKLEELFSLQRELQVLMPPLGRDPSEIDNDADRIEFIMTSVYALEDELHELTGEIGWKPWATSRHINRDAALSEAIDALHFLVNIFLVLRASADEVMVQYRAKRQKNIDRQQSGYDGVEGKCRCCKRAYDDDAVRCHDDPNHPGFSICYYGVEET
jgi:dimeric dUTPase (all-alpha-NTP-PPase superfamily)